MNTSHITINWHHKIVNFKIWYGKTKIKMKLLVLILGCSNIRLVRCWSLDYCKEIRDSKMT
ncbi:hypothetical protein [Candidatus Hodgkinia cicadicola]|uniref:hypothetical protein n=1 Tax=Candidatus Hodgkinia cicadicola TaxID=573658 RepID=UPI0011BAA25C